MNYLPTDVESFGRLFANTAYRQSSAVQNLSPGTWYYNNEFELTWKEETNSAMVFRARGNEHPGYHAIGSICSRGDLQVPFGF